MKKKRYSWSALLLISLLMLGIGFTACDEGEDLDTNQLNTGETALNSFGPSPAMRGGELRFIGTNLNKVSSIDLPGAEGIKEITAVGQYEIRIIIPQNAGPGYVVLHTPKGEIKTKTPLSFTEPISISKVSPLAIKAGAVLTIEGDYLNTVEEIIFPDGVHVLKADFVSQTRAKIEVKVPITAQSGKVIVSDGADLLSDGEDIPTWIYSEEDLTVALPTVESISPASPKAGKTLTIAGTDLNLVASVQFDGAEVTELTIAQDAKSLTLTVPATAKDGDVVLVTHSGVEVAVGEVNFLKPTATIENVQESYGVGETVVLAGTDLDLVIKAAFTNDEEKEVTLIEGKINLAVTEAAQSGAITLILDNGSTLTIDGFATTKPEAILPDDATPLDELEITSTLSNRVTSLLFSTEGGEIKAEAKEATETEFKVVVPLEATSGAVTLVMDNGETVSLGEIAISPFTFAAISEFASETTSVGKLMQCSVVNGNNLTNVQLNGNDTEYMLVGTVLYVAVGTEIGENTVTLISNETKVDYTIIVEATGIVETVLDNTVRVISGWGAIELMIDFSSAPEGSNIRIRYTKDSDSPQVKVHDGHWTLVYNGTGEVPENGDYIASSDYLDLPLTLFPYSDWGYSIIFLGDGMTITSISWVKDFSAE